MKNYTINSLSEYMRRKSIGETISVYDIEPQTLDFDTGSILKCPWPPSDAY